MVVACATTLTDMEAEQSMKKAAQQFQDTMGNILAAVMTMKKKDIKSKDDEIAAMNQELMELKKEIRSRSRCGRQEKWWWWYRMQCARSSPFGRGQGPPGH